MSDTPTPGQIAYAAWHALIIPDMFPGYTEDWSQISDTEQRAWDAAALAVLAWEDIRQKHQDAAAIVAAINARERASLEQLRREAEGLP